MSKLTQIFVSRRQRRTRGLNVSLRSSANRGAEREPSSTLLATLQADAHTCETGSVQPFVVPSSAGRWATHGTEESGCG